MAEKLKSILKPTHWSLVIKAFVFAAAWLLLPLWLFAPIALYIYFWPWFQPWRLAAPMLLLVGLALFTPTNFWLAIVFALAFYLLLGIKDLVFVNRVEAYQALLILLMLLMSVRYFSTHIFVFVPGLWSLAMGVALFFLLRVTLLPEQSGSAASMGKISAALGTDNNEAVPLPGRALSGLSALLFWQCALVVSLLPLSPLYQSALLLVLGATIVAYFFDYVRDQLSRRNILMTSSFCFVFTILLLAGAAWHLS